MAVGMNIAVRIPEVGWGHACGLFRYRLLQPGFFQRAAVAIGW